MPKHITKNTTSKKKAAPKGAPLAKEDTTYFWRHRDERLQTPTTQFTDAEMETFAEYMSLQFELMLTLRRIANLVEFSEHSPDAIDAVDFINDKLFARCGQGSLLFRARKGGHIEPKGISPQAIYKALISVAAGAGCRTPPPHDLKKTFASDLIDASGDLSAV